MTRTGADRWRSATSATAGRRTTCLAIARLGARSTPTALLASASPTAIACSGRATRGPTARATTSATVGPGSARGGGAWAMPTATTCACPCASPSPGAGATLPGRGSAARVGARADTADAAGGGIHRRHRAVDAEPARVVAQYGHIDIAIRGLVLRVAPGTDIAHAAPVRPSDYPWPSRSARKATRRSVAGGISPRDRRVVAGRGAWLRELLGGGPRAWRERDVERRWAWRPSPDRHRRPLDHATRRRRRGRRGRRGC